MRLALMVSGVLTALTIPPVVLWLSAGQTGYGLMVGLVAVSWVAFSVAVGVREAQRQQFTVTFVRKLALATTGLALVVPVGLALPFLDDWGISMVVGWWAILTVIVGFIRYRRALTRQIERFQARASLWQIDRLALEIPIGVTLLALPLAALATWIGLGIADEFLSPIPTPDDYGILIIPCLIVLTPFVAIGILILCVRAMNNYTHWRGEKMALKKRDPLNLHESPLFGASDWRRTLIWESAIWIGLAVGLAVVMFLFLWITGWQRVGG